MPIILATIFAESAPAASYFWPAAIVVALFAAALYVICRSSRK